MRFEKGREYYYTKAQINTSTPRTERFVGPLSTALRMKCNDNCDSPDGGPMAYADMVKLIGNGRCDDGGYADEEESGDKCALGTDCSDCECRGGTQNARDSLPAFRAASL